MANRTQMMTFKSKRFGFYTSFKNLNYSLNNFIHQTYLYTLKNVSCNHGQAEYWMPFIICMLRKTLFHVNASFTFWFCFKGTWTLFVSPTGLELSTIHLPTWYSKANTLTTRQCQNCLQISKIILKYITNL